MRRKIALAIRNDDDYLRRIVSGAIRRMRSEDHPFVLIRKHEHLEKLAEPVSGALGFAWNDEEVAWYAAMDVPVVNVSARLSSVPLPSVLSDNIEVGRQAAEYFLDQGHRNFGYVGLNHFGYARQRYAGFAEVIEQRGFTVTTSDRLPRWEYTEEADRPARAARWGERLRPPMALFCSDDGVGKAAIDWSREAGLAVPGDVSVVSASNDEVTCEGSSPALSSVDVAPEQIGYQAASVLIGLIGGDAPPDEPLLIPPRDVVVRESSDAYAVTDPLVAEILTYIRKNVSEPLNVQSLTDRFPLSRASLYRAFDEALGRSPAKEITRARLRRARALLRESDQPLKTVARAAGFSSPQRLSQVFRREVGLTPNQYRRQYRLRPACRA